MLLLFTIFIQTLPSQIIFESHTRGGSEKITVNREIFRIENNGKMKEYPIDPSDWKKISAILKTVDLDKMSSYPAPTSKRNYDAAWHSTLSAHVGDQVYTSTVFDNTEAPEALSALMKKINQLKKKLVRN